MSSTRPAGSTARAPGPIRSRRTYADLRKPSGRGRSGPVSVSFVDRTGWARPEVAFAVNRKVGSAVERNLLRRRMRSILRERTPGLPPGAYLVRCDPTGTALDFHELKVAMSHALEKATSRTATPTGVGESTRPGGER